MPNRIIGENNVEPSFTIDDYKFDIQNGVSNIRVQHRDHYGWDIEYTEIDEVDIETYYYYIDGIYDTAFSHWIFESGIYLNIFNRLQEKYPSIKLLSFHTKMFKSISYEAYNIPQSCIVNHIENNKNKVIFIKYGSLADHTNCEQFLAHVRKWHNYLIELRSMITKDIDILYLPRSRNENYREISEISSIQQRLIPAMEQYPNTTILYTDDIKNIADQVEIIRRAKIIILNEGSNFLVNGFFAEDSHIIIIGGHGPGGGYHFQNPRIALACYDSVKRGSVHYHVAYSEQVSNIIELIHKIKEGTVKPAIIPDVTCWRENWRGCNECNAKNGNTLKV